MDLRNLRAQDGMTQIATNDHYKARGKNGKEQEKSNLVLIAKLHMGVTLSSPSNLLLNFVFNPPRYPVCAKGNTLKKIVPKWETSMSPKTSHPCAPSTWRRWETNN